MFHAIISNGKGCIFISNFRYPSHVSLHFAVACVSCGLETILPGTVTYRAYLGSYRQFRGRWLVKNDFLFSHLYPKKLQIIARVRAMRPCGVRYRYVTKQRHAGLKRLVWNGHSLQRRADTSTDAIFSQQP